MKRIVLCFDGTWNKPGDETLPPEERVESNVSRFFRSVAGSGADGVEQVKWYNQGVGTRWYDRIIGGTLALGSTYIIAGYQHLAETYSEGDEVFVLGFSRGAYTARSLVGMVRNCGLVSSSAELPGWRPWPTASIGLERMAPIRELPSPFGIDTLGRLASASWACGTRLLPSAFPCEFSVPSTTTSTPFTTCG